MCSTSDSKERNLNGSSVERLWNASDDEEEQPNNIDYRSLLLEIRYYWYSSLILTILCIFLISETVLVALRSRSVEQKSEESMRAKLPQGHFLLSCKHDHTSRIIDVGRDWRLRFQAIG